MRCGRSAVLAKQVDLEPVSVRIMAPRLIRIGRCTCRNGDWLMSVSGKRTPPARWVGALLLVPALGVLGACGSSATSANSGAAAAAGGGGGGGLPASLQTPAIQDLTGAAGFAGLETQQGQRLAIDQINSPHFLGSTTLSLTYSDTQSTPQIAAQAASSAVKSNAPLAFGPVLSTVSLAVG